MGGPVLARRFRKPRGLFGAIVHHSRIAAFGSRDSFVQTALDPESPPFVDPGRRGLIRQCTACVVVAQRPTLSKQKQDASVSWFTMVCKPKWRLVHHPRPAREAGSPSHIDIIYRPQT